MTDHPFQPGEEVAVVSRGRWDSSVAITRVKVAKVYKNGNFIVEGSSQQYRPRPDGKSARETGAGSYSRPSVEKITPGLLAQVAQTELNNRGKSLADMAIAPLSKLRGCDLTADHIADLERVVALAKGIKP